MDSHRLAQLLFALPARPVGINYNGEHNAYAAEPWVETLDGKEVILIGLEGELPSFKGPFPVYDPAIHGENKPEEKE
jgi:hypothetical protein